MKIIAVTGNIVGIGFLLFAAVRFGTGGWLERVIVYGGLLGLNTFALFVEGIKRPSSRLFRMWGLWLDAKENELKKRAGKGIEE